MARPVVESLEYINIDVGIFDDIKILHVSERFGLKGELIAIKILLWVYSQSYYAKWSDEVALILSKKKFGGIPKDLVIDVVNELLKRDFFNEDIFKRFGILTSHGIQKRWMEVVTRAKRKCSIKPEFNLLIPKIVEETPAIQEETHSQVEETPLQKEESTQSKVKESKVKEIDTIVDSEESPPVTFSETETEKPPKYEPGKEPKLKYVHEFIRDHKPNIPEPYKDLWNLFAKKNALPEVRAVTTKRKRKLLLRLKEQRFDLSAILARAQKSNFIITDGKWFGFDWLIKNDENYLKVLDGNYDNKKSESNAATTTSITELSAAEKQGRAIIESVIGKQ